VSHLALLRHRLSAVLIAAFVAFGLAAAGVVATVPAASSSPSPAGSAPTPEVVAQVLTDTAAESLAQARLARTLLVFGDSISARFNDRVGDPSQGFWSMLADKLDARPNVRAEGGSGFVNPGLVGCTGNTFGDHLAQPALTEVVAGAGAVIIEGGRTDTQTCRRDGGYDLVPKGRVRRAVESFMSEVERLRGAGDACTIVVVPWGPKGLADNRDRITRVVRNAALRHGFTFVDTLGLLTETNTLEDRVHPNRDGNRALTRAILRQSGAEGCFA